MYLIDVCIHMLGAFTQSVESLVLILFASPESAAYIYIYTYVCVCIYICI